MWAFRKEIHKIGSYIKEDLLPCSADIGSKLGGQGVYFIDIELGTDIGLVSVEFNAQGIPDRFNLVWDGDIVADSKYVGDGLSGNPPSYPGLLGTFNNVQEYNFSGSTAVPTGNSFNITVAQNDIANGTAQEPTDGNITLSFVKHSATPTNLRIVSFGVLDNTLFNVTPSCPEALPTEPVFLGYNSVAGSNFPCSTFSTQPVLYFITQNTNLSTATQIFSDPLGNDLANSGFYSDGQITRQWGGTAFIGAPFNCTTEPVTIRYSALSSTSACQNSATTYFIPVNSDFSTTTEIYSSVSGTNFANAGFYSNGNLWRQWNGSSFINEGIC